MFGSPNPAHALRRTLDLAVEAERALGELYGLFASRSSDLGWRAFWARIARDELCHSQGLRLQARLAGKQALLGETTMAEGEIRAALEQVRRVREDWDDRSVQPADALHDALRLEETLVGLHADRLVTLTHDAGLRRLFANMGEADRRHVGLLQEALRQGRPPLPGR
jgi:rubrerythrin